jgi:GNAT superfamily N-acetyltransferase
MTRGIGKYQIPVMIIGRLAIDKSEQRKGLGKALLKDAIIRTKAAEEIAGLRAIIVHAKDKEAQDFYMKYGFIPALDDLLTLFFPIELAIINDIAGTR